MTLGPLFFASPWALAALAALPALFWLLRATPPAPRRTVFPPLRLLLGLRTEEEARQRAPLWLVLLRALMAALAILAFARPSLAPAAPDLQAGGETLLVIDDGWTSAPAWSQARSAAEQIAAETERAGGQLRLLLTAAERAEAPAQLGGADARARITRLNPQAWRPDREIAAQSLDALPARPDRVVWISDGLDSPGAAAFGARLAGLGPLTVHTPGAAVRAVAAAAPTPEGLEVRVRRSAGPEAPAAIAAETAEGRSLAAAEAPFPPGALETAAALALPPEIAARAAKVRIVGEASAGAVRLIPKGQGRPLVGLIDPGAEGGQTLLSDLYYVERAISPFASARRGGTASLIDQGAQALVLPDASRVSADEAAALAAWLEAGGLLIRFAGPRLANDQDEFLPAPLRPGARALGGALAWERPQTLAPFPEDGPYAGLAPPGDVAVTRQVLTEPAAEREIRVWARLADGAPIVTAGARGAGLVVLFHVTAGPAWSQLPLSGTFVEMLKRTLAFAGAAKAAEEARDADEPWTAQLLVDGFGVLKAPRSDPPAITAAAMDDGPRAGPAAPPGLYVRSGGQTAAINAADEAEDLSPLPIPANARTSALAGGAQLDLAGPFLALAALLLIVDLGVSLALTGRAPALSWPPRWPWRQAAVLALCVLAFAPAGAWAQGPADPTLTMRLAYLRTGDARLDQTSEAGLAALSQTLRDRTSVEPADPIGVDPARDDLSALPMLYWAAPSQPTRLSDAAVRNLDRYMRLGGLVFLDTRDAGAKPAEGAPQPAAVLLQGIDAPPLEPVTDDHVLTKAFYLIKSFPGRRRGAQVWAESASAAAARDGVAALMVGDGDWAAAWAAGGDGGADRQTEMSLRFGVNLVMVALTGNYKADQVHVPALLERLGQEPGRTP